MTLRRAVLAYWCSIAVVCVLAALFGDGPFVWIVFAYVIVAGLIPLVSGRSRLPADVERDVPRVSATPPGSGPPLTVTWGNR
jgi:hypothetical protein